ncbi:hypothetical protein ABFT80_15575 [Mesorhizobium sp. SB112]|uniref:hypothetical protein n=1 Tax=Mesorhizobium sp. SB112 TaxID=3151853 RepID=UPI003265EE85
MRIRGEGVEEFPRAHHAVFLGGTAEGCARSFKWMMPRKQKAVRLRSLGGIQGDNHGSAATDAFVLFEDNREK